MVSLLLTGAVIILLSTSVSIALPHLQRPDNLFSVTIAQDTRHHPEVQILLRRWHISSAVIGLVVAGVCMITFLFSPSSLSFMLPVFVLVYSIMISISYMAFHRQAFAFGLPAEGNTTRVASLRPRSSGTLIFSWWELVPLSVIVLTAILLAMRYPTAPSAIPLHFDPAGHATRFATKSPWTFFSLIGVQLSVWAILTVLGAGVSMARVAPSTAAAGEAYRRMWVRLILVMKTGTMNLLSISYLLTTSHSSSGTLVGPMAVLPIVLNVTLLTLMLVLVLRYGQSGWRLLRRTGSQLTTHGDATPDGAWKGGLFYYNPNDPALFVEKRSGPGWTMNFGHSRALLVLIGLLLGSLLLNLLPVLFQH
jgi:uncharacterized membrane protein